MLCAVRPLIHKFQSQSMDCLWLFSIVHFKDPRNNSKRDGDELSLLSTQNGVVYSHRNNVPSLFVFQEDTKL